MRQTCRSFVALVLLAGLGGMAAADPTFIEGRLDLRLEAQVTPDVVQWRTLNRDLTGGYTDINASTTISSSTNNGSIVTYSSAQASWASTARGSVHFGATGYVQAVFNAGGNSNANSSGWTYTFTTGDEDTFTLRYTVDTSAETDDPAGLEGFVFVVLQNGQAVYSQNLDLDSDDTVAVSLNPSQTYTVQLLPVVEVVGGLGLNIASMTGDFDWAVTTGGASIGGDNGKAKNKEPKLRQAKQAQRDSE